MTIMVTMIIIMLVHGWKPPRSGEGAQKDTVLKFIAIHCAQI